MEINCPKCDKELYVEYEDIPETASEDFEITCEHCNHEFKAGWCSDLEYR